MAVDLHCHLLPGLDDGAEDLADAVAMAHQAQADGIDAICATPHIRHDHDVDIAELPARRAELTAALGAAGCRVRVLAGGEVAVTELDQLDDPELAAVSLGGAGRWVLLEPASGPLDERLERAVGDLRRRGFRAVIAHPERHLVADLHERLGRLVEVGALVQATAEYLTNETTRAGMVALARDGLIHVLGSDSHSSRFGRRPALAGALAVLGSVPGLTGHIAWIGQEAPRAIVEGKDLSPPFAGPP